MRNNIVEIVKGRELIDKLEGEYKFDCEAGSLKNCADWQELKRCFYVLANNGGKNE